MFSYHTCCIWSLQLNLKGTYWRFDGLAGSRFIVSEKEGEAFSFIVFVSFSVVFSFFFLILSIYRLHPCNNLHSLIAASRRHNEATLKGQAEKHL